MAGDFEAGWLEYIGSVRSGDCSSNTSGELNREEALVRAGVMKTNGSLG